ncbi:probable RNA polymerase sigma factor SigA at C-terminar half [Coccomyxa sp. Obi]|nr:probable RNA polymerase sigma factor SigA at C-terminar half [Coccomyxa sp. Obi]
MDKTRGISPDSLEGLLEHRWRNGAALFEMHIYRELAADLSGRQAKDTALGNQVLAASVSIDMPRGTAANKAEDTRNEYLEHLWRAHGDARARREVEEIWLRDARSVQNRHHIHAELDSRRHARRLRRQQADMAAAVAGAVVGVEPRAVLAAAQAKLLEERRATGAAASFRGAGSRLREWDPLRQQFRAADSAILRRPRVMRSVNEALLMKERKRDAQHDLLSREEELALIHTMRAGQRLQMLMSLWQEKAARPLLLEEVAAQASLGSAEAVRETLKAAADAQYCLITSNIRMVHKVASQYRNMGNIAYEDLVQAGLEGLHDGLRRYEPMRGTRLCTCLYFSIRNCVVKESRRQNRVVTVPGNAQMEQVKLEKALTAFIDHHSREPTLEELSDASGFSRRELQRLLRLGASREVFSGAMCKVSKGKASGDASPNTWGDTLEEQVEEAGRPGNLGQGLELQRLMDLAISCLPEKEQVVVRCFYGLDGRPHSQREIGELLSTSEHYVSQLLNKARNRLRKQHAQKLLAYL